MEKTKRLKRNEVVVKTFYKSELYHKIQQSKDKQTNKP